MPLEGYLYLFSLQCIWSKGNQYDSGTRRHSEHMVDPGRSAVSPLEKSKARMTL